jgi:hypothetical protein
MLRAFWQAQVDFSLYFTCQKRRSEKAQKSQNASNKERNRHFGRQLQRNH